MCFVQEHWLHKDHLNKIRHISADFLSVSSPMYSIEAVAKPNSYVAIKHSLLHYSVRLDRYSYLYPRWSKQCRRLMRWQTISRTAYHTMMFICISCPVLWLAYRTIMFICVLSVIGIIVSHRTGSYFFLSTVCHYLHCHYIQCILGYPNPLQHSIPLAPFLSP